MSKEIVNEVSKRTGLPPEQIEVIIADLWGGVKYYFYKPHEAKYGILLNEFIKIKLRRQKIRDYITYQQKLNTERGDYLATYWSDVLNNLKKYGNLKLKKESEKHDG